MKFLGEHFINCWTLVHDLEEISADNFEDRFLRDASKKVLQAYKFPVQSMVALPNGSVIATLNANDWLAQSDEIQDDSMWTSSGADLYLDFLENALKTFQKDDS